MSDDWDFYFCRVNDVLSSLFVDLGLHEAAPDPERTHLLWIWIPFRSPRDDGLSSAEEAPTLGTIESELVDVLGRELNAVFVGRITGGGRRELYFYATAPEGFRRAVTEVCVGHPGYDFDFGDQPDPDWSQYFDVLYPSPRDIQRMKNRRVIEALEAEGDPLEEARPVAHWIYFDGSAQSAVAADRLAAAGFQTDEIRADPDGGQRRSGLRIERVDRVDSTSIDTVVLEILDLVDGLGATYDGWECPVMKPARATPGFLGRLLGRSG